MRNELKNYVNKDNTFSAVVVRIGTRKSRKTGKLLATMLVRQLKDVQGNLITDHMWLDIVPELAKLHPLYGDIIEFNGTTEFYIKGSCNRRKYYNTGRMYVDYQIKQLHDFKVVGEITEEQKEELLGWYSSESAVEEG